eukprot:XP_019928265.1 PREDICTED: uncharacterized protein LOC105341681 [Crassostrea gigas]
MTRNYIICKMKFKLYRLAILFLCMPYIYTEKCLVNNKDFSAVERFGPWEVISYDGNNTYQINLCGRVPAYSAGVGISNCHNDTVVCMVQDGQAFSLANYTNSTINSPSNDEEAEMWIVRNGNGSTDLAGENLNSIINFKCGKTLKRRTLRQTLQRQREEQERLAQQVTQKNPGVEGNGSAPGRGPVGQGNGYNLPLNLSIDSLHSSVIGKLL